MSTVFCERSYSAHERRLPLITVAPAPTSDWVVDASSIEYDGVPAGRVRLVRVSWL